MRLLPSLTFLAAGLLVAFSASAQSAANYPERAISLVIGYPPGGQTDSHARVLAKLLATSLGQPVIVDSHPGAGTTIAAAYVAHAKPDGYTLLMAGSSMLTLAPHTFSSLRYKIEDFQTISLTSLLPSALIINPKALPVKDFKEFVAYAKANPGKLSYATVGVGGPSHLLGELIARRMGIEMVPIHYKGSGPALSDVLTGRVPVIIDSLPPHLPHIAQGNEQGLAITTEKRLPGAPQVPTFAELGYPELGMMPWSGIVVPKGTPKPIADKLYKAIVDAVNTDEFQKRVIADATIPMTNTPAEFDALIKRDNAVWGEVVRKIGGVKLD